MNNRPRSEANPCVLILGPARTAMSGVSAHLNQLFESDAAREFELRHFQVGSEGRNESRGAKALRLITSPLALAAAVLRHRAAVVHLNSALNVGAYWRDLCYMLVARALGARVIFQQHGGALPETFFGRRRLPRAFLRATLKLPHALLVLARSEQASYRRFLPGRPVVLLPNGVALPEPPPPERQTRAVGDPLRLLYIGRLALEKGLYETLQAVADARAAGIAAVLTIGGGGPEEAGLRAFAGTLGITQHVHFAGPLFGDAKRQAFADAHVLVLASYAEGLPYALLEGMAAGLPVIATPVGAIPDVVDHGRHGCLVAPGDPDAITEAITWLARKPLAQADMGRAAAERIAQGYTSERMTRGLTRAYRQLCAGPDRRACALAVEGAHGCDQESTL